jgi:toxoflavin biosynthesis protein ToxD
MRHVIAGVVMVSACGSSSGKPVAPKPSGDGHAALSLAADARMVLVPAGQFIAGSTPEERVSAYEDYLATSGHDSAREHGWFDHEEERHIVQQPAYLIDLMPVTQSQYGEFVAAGQATAPTITEAAWKDQGFTQDFASEVTRFLWKDGRPPAGREDHPVVLVTYDEAKRYCAWRGEQRGEPRRLPTAAEYEKAVRGESGNAYPWGNAYEADKLNSRVKGPNDTTPVGQFSAGASSYGVLDLAGNVFEWTSTAMPGSPVKMIVKGSAWEDYAGVGRGASGHGRPTGARHVIVGFRCAADPPPT